MIQERDDLLGKTGAGNMQTVEMSASIRKQLRKIKDQSNNLTAFYEADKAKAEKHVRAIPPSPANTNKILFVRGAGGWLNVSSRWREIFKFGLK